MTTRTPPTAGKSFPVGLTITTFIALGVLIWLGAWQLQRLAWKQDLLTKVAALQSAPARPLGPALQALAQGADVGFTRVRFDCPGLGAAPYLELYGVRGGQGGVRLISACAVAAGPYRSVLVDRGFVADTVAARPAIDPADRTPLALTGVLRAPEPASFVTPKNEVAANHWYSRDVAAMARKLGAKAPAPVFLMAGTSSNPGWRDLTPSPLPKEISNRHLEYALTWFGLAGALGCVYAAVLWRRRRD